MAHISIRVIKMIDIYQMVTERVIKTLEGGKIPWLRPWHSSWPSNIATGKEYQGVNQVLLSCTDYGHPYWCTLKQANRMVGSIRRGEKASTFVVFAKETVYISEDQDGNDIPKKGFVLTHRSSTSNRLSGLICLKQ